MARAGFCSECGDDVELTDDGCCPEGHGSEAISDIRDVDAAEAGAVPASKAAATVSPEAEHHGAAPMGEIPPQRNRTGMIVFAAAAVLLLVALIAGAFVLLPALKKTSGTKTDTKQSTTNTPEAYKSRVTTSISFLGALFSDDTMKIRPLLTAEARNAITDEQWKEVASAFPTSTVTFSETKWTSDTTAVVGVKTEGGSAATLTVGAGLNTTDTVNLVLTVQENEERALLRLRQEKDGWHILSITDATGGATLYDDAFVESLLEEASKKQ